MDVASTIDYSLNVLVVDDDINIRKILAYCLQSEGHKVVAVSNSADAVAESARRAFDLAFIDLRIGAEKGLDLLPLLHGASPWMKTVVITAFPSIDNAVKSMQSGSVDYLPKPFIPADVKHVAQRIARMRRLEQNVAALQDTVGRASPAVNLHATRSPVMQRAVHLAQQVAVSDTTVLIRGESGVGKGALGRAIHDWSARAAKPFASVSCPSLSADLLESELFGHVKGAFPSAVNDYAGRITTSEGGTIFLDEVGDLPLALQPKLLRLLQDREFQRMGEHITRQADVRIITACHIDLDQAAREGRFREDLLYRLNVIQIDIPPLRDRREDIVPIAQRMLAFFSRNRSKKILGFTPESLEILQRHPWPGNIRELRNVIERCAILATGDWITPEVFPGFAPSAGPDPVPGALISLDQIEELHIRRVLAATKSLDDAAKILGIDAATLWRRRKKYGI